MSHRPCAYRIETGGRSDSLEPGTHRRIRSDHTGEVAEDYVEAIYQQIEANGSCRSVDLVRRFEVTHATVSKTIARLQRDGLVSTEPYRPIDLTAKGKRLANKARKRHEIVERFLLAIGVSPETAAVDSEGIEHHVSRETLAAMQRLVNQRQSG